MLFRLMDGISFVVTPIPWHGIAPGMFLPLYENRPQSILLLCISVPKAHTMPVSSIREKQEQTYSLEDNASVETRA